MGERGMTKYLSTIIAGKRCAFALLAAILTVALPGCWDKDEPKNPPKSLGEAPPPVERPVSEAELTARLQREIDETQMALDEAVKMQDRLSTEIEVLQQLLEETETELVTHEDTISRLEAQR